MFLVDGEKEMLRKDIKEFIEFSLDLYYDCPDAAHGVKHITEVIEHAVAMANEMKLNENIAAVAACFHDIGLIWNGGGRELHHLKSGQFIEENVEVFRCYFTDREIEKVKAAVEEHRSSYTGEYSSIYSIIVSDADRSCDIITMISRSYLYNRDHGVPQDKIYNEVFRHLTEKYGKEGRVKLHLPYAKELLKASQEIIADENKFKAMYEYVVKNL